MTRTALESRQNPGGLFAIEDMSLTTGSRFYVHSVTGSDAAGYGTSPDAPVATIDYAIGLCTASKGDIIYVMPGHNEGLGSAQIAVDVIGVQIIGLGKGSLRPRIDFDNANASIDISVSGCLLRNLVLLPSVTGVLVGIDVMAGALDTVLEDIEILPGEDGGGVDEMIVGIDIGVGCTRTAVRRVKHLQHASVAHAIACVKLTGASDDVLIEDCYLECLGGAAVAPINGDTTLSTRVLIRRNLLVSDTQPGIELLTATTGVIADNSIFSNLASIAAAIAGNGGALGTAQFRNEYVEVAPERGALIGTASVDD